MRPPPQDLSKSQHETSQTKLTRNSSSLDRMPTLTVAYAEDEED